MLSGGPVTSTGPSSCVKFPGGATPDNLMGPRCSVCDQVNGWRAQQRRTTAGRHLRSTLNYQLFARGYFILAFPLLVTLVVSVFSTSSFSTRSLGYIAILGLAAIFSFQAMHYWSQGGGEASTEGPFEGS